mmetsp:Transcript_32403/g.82549  ORF Transcript_32403/g.82549 Transcript_32403/m.82549 type:complete len:86 (+) Transcript_32403:1280-1537(+)
MGFSRDGGKGTAPLLMADLLSWAMLFRGGHLGVPTPCRFADEGDMGETGRRTAPSQTRLNSSFELPLPCELLDEPLAEVEGVDVP